MVLVILYHKFLIFLITLKETLFLFNYFQKASILIILLQAELLNYYLCLKIVMNNELIIRGKGYKFRLYEVELLQM